MPNAYLFADEAGDFKFRHGAGASRFFILCTIRVESCDVGADLLDLRRRMLLRRLPIGEYFHATSDAWPVRKEVYNLLRHHAFRIDATVLEKDKAWPVTRIDEATFYQYAWFYHAKYVIPHRVNRGHDLLITAAALETKVGKAAFKLAFNNAIQQTARGMNWATDFPRSGADPCLQVADYCAWAIQRQWENGNADAYSLIENNLASEFDLWRMGTLRLLKKA